MAFNTFYKMSEEYEQPVPSPFTEKEITVLGRAAADLGWADRGGVNAFLSDVYDKLHRWGLEAHKYNEEAKQEEEGGE